MIGALLPGSSIAKVPQVLGQNSAPVSHTGDTNEFTLATITVPANAMGKNGLVVVKPRFSFTGSAGTKTIGLKFGGNYVAHPSASAALTGYRIDAEIANRGDAGQQFTSYVAFNSGSAAGGQTNGTLAVDTTASVDIVITGQLASAADTITLESYQVTIVPR